MKLNKSFLVIGAIVMAALGTFVMFTQLTQARRQDPPGNLPLGDNQTSNPVSIEADLGDIIPVQGRLTNSTGIPLDGLYPINLYVYDVITGGAVLCGNWFPSVQVDHGLFNAAVHLCGAAGAIDGQQLYLGVQVGADPEMTPRLPIYAVPYAYNVKPGAVIKGANTYITVPGTAFIKDQDTDTTRWDLLDASARIFRGGTFIGSKHIRIPITIPSVLYGQPVKSHRYHGLLQVPGWHPKLYQRN